MSKRRWTDAEVSLLGTATDGEIAKAIGCHISSVLWQRLRLGIPTYYSASQRALKRTEAWRRDGHTPESRIVTEGSQQTRIGRGIWRVIDWRLDNTTIALSMGVSRQAVNAARKRYGHEKDVKRLIAFAARNSDAP